MDKVKDLTSGSIIKGITSLATPLIAASFIQMAYTMTDMAWLGRLGSEHVAAVGAASFIIWLCNSISYITKIGAEISISQALGRGSRVRAKAYANHATLISILLASGVAVVVFCAAPLFVRFFSLSDSITDAAISYLRLVVPGLFFTCNNNTFGGVYYGMGNSKTPFRISAAGLVSNMVLDPVFIFGFGIIPALGTNGAAIATTLSQLLVFILFASRLYTKRFPLGKLRLRFLLRRRFSLRILKLGLPVSLQNMFFASLSSTLAFVAARFGHVGVAVFSVGSQIEAVSWMTAGGFSTALGSYVGQNFGAHNMKRVIKGYQLSLFLAGSIGVVAGLAFIFAGQSIFSLFIDEPETAYAGGQYLQILGISQLFMVVELVTAGAFNGVGRTMPPAILSMVLNALRIPMAFALITIPMLGMTGIWWSITISSILKGTILVFWFYYSVIRRSKI